MGALEVSPFAFHCPEETFGYTHLSAGDLLREDCIFAAMNSFTRVFHPCCITFICQLFLIANSIMTFFWRSVRCKTYSHLWVFKMKYCITVSFDLPKVAEFSNIEVSQGGPPVVFDGCLPGEKSRRLRIWWAYQQLHQGGLWTVGNWNDLWRSSCRLVDDENWFSNRPKNGLFWISMVLKHIFTFWQFSLWATRRHWFL